MSILLIVGFVIVAIVIGFYANTMVNEDNIALSIVILIMGAIGLLFIIIYINNTPTALDVYKGRTELRITYDGKVPVDSVVIYKKGGLYD